MTPAERWYLQQLAITLICHVQTVQDLPKIWTDLTPMKKENSRTALDITCIAQAQALGLKPTKIPHTVAVLLLGLAFHT